MGLQGCGAGASFPGAGAAGGALRVCRSPGSAQPTGQVRISIHQVSKQSINQSVSNQSGFQSIIIFQPNSQSNNQTSNQSIHQVINQSTKPFGTRKQEGNVSKRSDDYTIDGKEQPVQLMLGIVPGCNARRSPTRSPGYIIMAVLLRTPTTI